MGKRIAAILGIIISSIYLLNFGMGVLFELPDTLPLLGNIDEFVAATLLITSLKHFDIDFTNFLTLTKKKKQKEGKSAD